MKNTILTLIVTLFSIVGSAQNPQVGLEIGNKAPEIILKNPVGKTIPLSSLQGKVVLIDFWASWCRPCRMENPNIVSAYQKYSKAKFKTAKGFDIYSVSLDRSKESWVQAIEADKLTWNGHVSDLKHWQSEAAKIYQIRGIPYNYLIDENGIIISKGLRGVNLHKTLDNLVESF